MIIDLVTANPERFVLRFWNYTQGEHETLLDLLGHLANGRLTEGRLDLSSPAFGIVASNVQLCWQLAGRAGERQCR